MNFLAHLFLSCKDEDLLIGNFLADFLKKKEADSLSERYKAGIQLHRKIDQYTDNHPIVIQGVRRLYPYHSKYASVIIDIFYDYFLIKNWNEFSSQSFPDFRRQVYSILLDHINEMPSALRPNVEHMVNGDWLASYGNEEGILYAVSRMSRRASRPELLENAGLSLSKYQDAFNEEFLGFFPAVIQEIDCFC